MDGKLQYVNTSKFELFDLLKHNFNLIAYLHRSNLRRIRALVTPGTQIFQDVFDEDIAFLKLDFSNSLTWPPNLEQLLNSLPSSLVVHQNRGLPVTTSAPPPVKDVDYAIFTGIGKDCDLFHCVGVLHPLPPQLGISGWQRITFLKVYDSTLVDAGFHPDEADLTRIPLNLIEDGYWAYEGAVLPGGNMMLGRWWYPDPDVDPTRTYSGPFMHWHVNIND
ncbi:hypothetical protein MMC20_004413 [Loxospora ochrophaea]|nr:hypothetical protein [Loxospora ochrophaea]